MTSSPLGSTSRPAAAMDLTGAALTGGLNGWSTNACPELEVEEMVLLDGPLGVVSRTMDERDTALLMPSGTALAATWDTELVSQVGKVLGQQARERSANVVLGPNLNLPRSPLSGRAFEMFSEDPFLTGDLGAAWVQGVQSQGVGSCAKHVVANDTETERRRMNSRVDEAALREIYLRPFETAVRRANPWMLMMAYNRVNGVHCSQHRPLINILKGDWHYDGVVVSDWFGVDNTNETAEAGLDLEMPGPARFLGDRFAEAVTAGEVTEARLQDAVQRMVRLADRTGRRAGRSGSIQGDSRDEAEQRKVLRTAAARSFVLLENRESMLPLNPGRITTLAVIGPNATKPCFQGGTFATVRPEGALETPLDAIRRAMGPGVEVSHEPGIVPASPLQLTELGSTAPDGTPGILLEVLETGGTGEDRVLYSEVRKASSFVWFGAVPGLGAGAPGKVRISSRLTLAHAARWTFGAGGTGTTALTVNGNPVLDVPPPAPDDVMGVVARGETTGVSLDLPAGNVDIVADMVFEPGRVQSVTAVAAPEPTGNPLARAVELAGRTDAVVLVLGDDQGSSRESADRTTAALDPACDELVDAVSGMNPNTAVVVNASRAVLLPWADKVKAVLMAWFPGQEFGPALASVLTGQEAPSGRLPVSFPARDEDIPGFGTGFDAGLTLDYSGSEPTGYRHFEASGRPARYPFGYGLGYTRFELVEATAAGQGEASREPADGVHGISVRTSIRNCGEAAGRDVLQVYGKAPGEDSLRLMGYAQVDVAAGSTAAVEIPLDPAGFRRWNGAASCWSVPPGDWELRVGRHAADPGILCRISL
ncbi:MULTISPECIES: beta-glucosidase [unclassified Arthrobacter]|uniref:beta-glucosidase n=1 Tax=unclassified Arthrobacter TaxID=235627 RepID=UPI00254F5AC6|nr:glycoside hydrolase family 3 C-terminal domain-containing protein [Arthrobacter sp. fls2-241-R2A-172]